MRLRHTSALALASALTLSVLSAAAPASADDVERAPLRTISGAATGLDLPRAAARDSADRLYVANAGGDSITVYAPSASGNTAPLRTIKGSNTKLDQPIDLAIDADDYLYVANFDGANVAVFPPGAHDNASPVRILEGANTSVEYPSGLTVANGMLYIADEGSRSILAFAKGSGGNVAPVRQITGTNTTISDPTNLAYRAGRLYVGSLADDAIKVFDAGANGNVAPLRIVGAAPAGTIDHPFSIDFDAAGRLYLGSLRARVSVFRSDVSGADPTPVRVLRGAQAGLEYPRGIEVSPAGRITALNYVENSVRVFAPLFAKPKPKVTRPGAVRSLKVKGKPRARRWIVDWRKPSKTGHAPINRYKVIVKKRGKTVHKEIRKATRAKLTRKELKRKGTLRYGKYKVIVRAHNKKGWGPAKTKKFRVKRR